MPIIGHSSTQTRCETTPRIKKGSKALSAPLVLCSYLNLIYLVSYSCGHPQSDISNNGGFQFSRALELLIIAATYLTGVLISP